MVIRSLRLSNFGPYKDASVALDRSVTLILGENGTGKTTLTTAIEVLLCGRASRFAGHRIGLGALIGPSGDTAEVTGELDFGGRTATLQRRIGPKGLTTKVNDHETTANIFDYFSPVSMRDPERAWAAICNVGGVLDRDIADQKAVLLSLIDPDIPSETLRGLRFDLTGVACPTTLDRVESAYEAAYKARRVAKARLAEIALAEPERPRADLEAITRKMQELGERESALATQIGEGRGQRQALERERARLSEVLGRLQTELDGLGSEADAQKAVTTAEQALATAQKEREERLEQQAEEGRIRLRILAITALESTLAKQALECETCGTKLTADARKARADALKVERTKLETWLKKHGGGAQTLMKGSNAETGLDDAKRRLARIGQRQLEIAQKGQELNTLDAEMAKTPASDRATEDELTEVRARLKKGQQFAGDARALNQRWDSYDDSQIRWNTLSQEVSALERLCDVLGPKGIGERLLRERFDGVMGKLNRVLGRFGLQMDVQAEPSWALRFNGRPALLMSGSERWRAGFCFQVAVGALTGAKLAVVDGADILVGQSRTVLFDTAKEAVSKGLVDQVILTASAVSGEFKLNGDPVMRTLLRVYRLPAPGLIEALPDKEGGR